MKYDTLRLEYVQGLFTDSDYSLVLQSEKLNCSYFEIIRSVH